MAYRHHVRPVSWEITDGQVGVLFSPCGMIWSYLRSCYRFKMRLFVGGVPMLFPARWFFCVSQAKRFPFKHGCEASPWLKNYEINPYWGEVTPYPTDALADYSRGLDKGENPGYLGQTYIGQDQWFVDGKLPSDVLISVGRILSPL